MAVRIDGNNDLINAADGTLTIEGISVNVVGVSTASGGYKVGTAYTVFPNGNVATAGIVTATKLDISTNPAGGLPVIGLKHVSSGNDTFQITGGITDRTNGGFAIRDVEESSNRFVIDSNGKVGIGSEVPSHKLSISDSSPGVVINREIDSVNQLNFRTLGTQRGSLGASSGSCLQVHDASSVEKFRILQNGKVGINTNNPAHLLDISGNSVAFPSAAGSTLLRLRDSSGTATLSIDSAAGSSSVVQFGDTAAASQGTILYNNNSDYFQFNTAGTGEKLRLDSSGNLGIGTNVFPVNGTNVKVSDGTIARFALHKTGSNTRNFEIGNGGTFLNVYDVTADAQRLRINSSGNLKLGTHTADRDLGGLSVQRLHIEGTDGGSSAIGLVNNQNSTGQAAVYFSKSRGTSVGSNTILQDDDPMGALVFCGADGNDMISIGAQITAEVDGTPGSNDMPGRLVFKTTADGAATATERLRITADGTKEFKNHGGGTIKVGGSSAHTSKIVIASNDGTANGNCLVEGGDGSDFFTIASNGNVNFTSGKGIGFSDTSDGPSMESELLDDYEEGSFTFSFSGGISITNNEMAYTKIGRFVMCTGRLTMATSGSNTLFQMDGLPFTPASLGNSAQGGVIPEHTKGSDGPFFMAVESSSNKVRIRNGASTAQTIANVSGHSFRFQLTYFTT